MQIYCEIFKDKIIQIFNEIFTYLVEFKTKPLIKQADIIASLKGFIRVNFIVNGVDLELNDNTIRRQWFSYLMNIPYLINICFPTKFKFKFILNKFDDTN